MQEIGKKEKDLNNCYNYYNYIPPRFAPQPWVFILKQERISIFIDGSNFYHILKDLFPNKTDKEKFK